MRTVYMNSILTMIKSKESKIYMFVWRFKNYVLPFQILLQASQTVGLKSSQKKSKQKKKHCFLEMPLTG